MGGGESRWCKEEPPGSGQQGLIPLSAWEISVKAFRFSQPQPEIGAALLHLQGWCDKAHPSVHCNCL